MTCDTHIVAKPQEGLQNKKKQDDADRSATEVSFNYDAFHNIPKPPTPEPSPWYLDPPPVRYPDTVGYQVEIRKSKGRGLGMFALEDILPGTILLCELPMVVLQSTDTDTETEIDKMIDALTPEKKSKFMSLSATLDEKTDPDDEKALKNRIIDCNAFAIMDKCSASGIFETASRINHCCVPNASYEWRDSIGRLVVWNRFKLLNVDESRR